MRADTRITEIVLADWPDRDDLVAEFWSENEHWGTLFEGEDQLLLEIYPQESGRPWVLDLEHLMERLKHAQRWMRGEQGVASDTEVDIGTKIGDEPPSDATPRQLGS